MVPLRVLGPTRVWLQRLLPSRLLGARRFVAPPLATQASSAPGPTKSGEEDMEERKAMLRAASTAWQARQNRRRLSALSSQAGGETAVEDVQGGPDAPPSSPGASSLGPRFLGTMEKKNMMAMDMTEFDSNGEIRVAGGKVSKMDLCSQHGLQPRDLRTVRTAPRVARVSRTLTQSSHPAMATCVAQLDNFKSQLPAILVRVRGLMMGLSASRVALTHPTHARSRRCCW